MSDRTVPDIDPRFDPRFQRGYVPDAAAPMSKPEPPPERVLPAVSAPDADADEAADADPADAILGLLAHAQAERLARSDGEPVDGPADGERAEHDSPGFDRAVEPPPDAEPMIDVSPTRWFWIAIGASVAFVVLGSVLFWVQVSDSSMYLGGPNAGLDETVRVVVTTLSPALVQAGVIGVIAVLVIWAVRGRSTPGDRR